MPRLKIKATCTATVTEAWIVDITADEYVALMADEATRQPSGAASEENLRDGLIDVGTYVGVENVRVDDEYDREIIGFELVADDFTDTPETALDDMAPITRALHDALSVLVTDKNVVMDAMARQQADEARAAYTAAFPGDLGLLPDVAPSDVLRAPRD